MRELDAAMLAYLDNHYTDADDEEKQLFRELLDMPDPELMGLVSGRNAERPLNPQTREHLVSNTQVDDRYDAVIARIRATLTA